MSHTQATLCPFLYPCLHRLTGKASRLGKPLYRQTLDVPTVQIRRGIAKITSSQSAQSHGPSSRLSSSSSSNSPSLFRSSHLNPAPSEYSSTVFLDKCLLNVHAGSGGNGCVSFLREKYINEGMPNGGDGGSGGNVWIQALQGHTSLHKLARRGTIRAEKGQGGQGKSQGGKRGKDAVIEVPVGTIVREVWRSDPVTEEEKSRQLWGDNWQQQTLQDEDKRTARRKDKWVLYPGSTLADNLAEDKPPLPMPRRSNLSTMQPKPPIRLDLSEHMKEPMLLAAGGMGGLGNPHFATKTILKPKFATKGEMGTRLTLELELKLLADVGLVGLPNVGKSTLLRSISNSRTRVGNWAFTTLAPSIGTVIIDNHMGRPIVESRVNSQPPRTSFTVADIPGLVEDAHLDKGLGLGFLRHIERAGILAFVVDLSAGNAVKALQNLWKEVGAYEQLRDRKDNGDSQVPLEGRPAYFPGSSRSLPAGNEDDLQENGGQVMSPSISNSSFESLKLPPISLKPWFVVATKADLEDSQENFAQLQKYVNGVQDGTVEHPSGKKNGWKKRLAAIPVSAKNGEGVDNIPIWIAGLLDK